MKKQNSSKIIAAIVNVIILIVLFLPFENKWFSVLKAVLAIFESIQLLYFAAKSKEHNLFKVIGASILIAVLLTWILPTTDFQYSLVSDGSKSQVGIFDLFKYPNSSVSYFGNVVVYILVIGGFYGVLNKIGAYRKLLDDLKEGKYFEKFSKISIKTILMTFALALVTTVVDIIFGKSLGTWIKVFAVIFDIIFAIVIISKLLGVLSNKVGKGPVMLSTIIVLVAIITSITGAPIAMLLLVPFIVSLVMLMGYDKLTASLVTIGAIGVGVIGTTFSSTYIVDGYNVVAQNTMGVINGILSTKATDQIIVKVVLLILGILVLIFNTVKYAEKNKSKNVEELELIPSETKKKLKKWPVALILDIVFIVTILSMISWTGVFGTKLFTNITNAFTGFKIFDFPIFAKLFGDIGAFESWSIETISIMLVMASAVLALIYKVKFNEYIESIAEGAKKVLKPALIVMLAYVVLIIVNIHPITLTMIKPLISSKLNVFTGSIAAFVSILFNVDTYYSASNVIPYIISLITDSSVYSIIAVIWQAMYGLVILVAPTSVVLLAILGYLNVSYGKWLKSNWKFLLEIIILVLICLTVLILI